MADLIRGMAAAGAPAEAIALAVQAIEDAQAAVESKRAVERDRKRRQRERDNAGTVTGQSRDSHAHVTPEPSPQSPPLKLPPDPLKITPPLTPQPKPKVSARGCRLPSDWQPNPLTGKTAEMVAAWPSGMIERQLAQFRDHYAKTPGEKGVSLDWQASWRTWLRNADDWKRPDGLRQPAASQGNNLRGSRPDPCLDLLRQSGAELAAESASRHTQSGGEAWPALPSFGPS